MPTFVRSPGVEAAPMLEETVLYDPAARQFCVLNPTAAFVWDRLAQPQTAETLVAGMRERFAGTERADVGGDVATTLKRFVELQLIRQVTEA